MELANEKTPELAGTKIPVDPYFISLYKSTINLILIHIPNRIFSIFFLYQNKFQVLFFKSIASLYFKIENIKYIKQLCYN